METYSKIKDISFCPNFDCNVQGDFSQTPVEGAEHDQKCIESKNWHHFEKPTFYYKQLCFYTYLRFFHSKGP